ncbi:MAG: aminotransferase class I/II-fold pyridoxal phosphate-dependent enzyme [Bradyrhizobiaceae bacterium]|nr:aminotransferase class I/II-fold pyridoxal phosphate-dependent enzyme [Bradyrhizobiaceae bacterium]
MILGPKHLLDIAAYKPGASVEEIRRTYGLHDVEKLASNENPFGPSPRAIEAAQQALMHAHLYNDGGLELRNVLASVHNHPVSGITVHNGSDAIIHQIMRTFLLPGDTALSCTGGFVSFGIAVRSAGNTPVFVPQAEGYRFDVDGLIAAIDETTKVVYVPNPNNPTGTHLTEAEVRRLLDHIPASTILILDEAYYEYASVMAPATYISGIALQHPNVLTLRTFSKAYGLASLRIGYAIGSPEVVQWLHKTKLPFDPNGVGCAAAVAALNDSAHVEHTVAQTISGMHLLSNTLNECGYTTSASVANFVFVDCGTAELATDFHLQLLHRGFITRPLAGFGIPTAVRITIGTPEQNHRLANVLSELSATFTNA